MSEDPLLGLAPGHTAYTVIGRYTNGSGMAEETYGPYTEQRAKQIAAQLTSGQWQNMEWTACPLLRTPWDRP